MLVRVLARARKPGLCFKLALHKAGRDSIRRKHNVRWQHIYERCLARFIFFLLMKTEQALSGTSAATYKVMEPQYKETQLSINNGILIVRHKGKCSASELKKLNGTHRFNIL